VTKDGISLFLCGDVMTGRGIDQILPSPSDPHLFEPYVKSAQEYVELARRASGPIAEPVDPAYIWGDALAELDRARPDVRIINLETAVTTAEDAWPGKEIHYRMHPANVACLSRARIDCCVLANNHVLDWGYRGLMETLSTLHAANIATTGAGRDATEAALPAIIEIPGKGRVLVFSFGMDSAGVPMEWAARERRAGVNVLPDLSAGAVEAVALQIERYRRAHDIVIVSIHWGSNWGYYIGRTERGFAHRLIEAAHINLVHGHSSHHPKGIEVYRGAAILYGCGDFLNDYEGISGYEWFRPELVLMYLATFASGTGQLARLSLVPMRIRHFSLGRARPEDTRWIGATLDREVGKLGGRLTRQPDHTFLLRWNGGSET